MDLLARAREAGEIRADLPLSLLRSAILGPMEHVLWDAVVGGRPVDIEDGAQHGGLAVPALLPPDLEVAALKRFYGEVGVALRRVEEGSRFALLW